MRPRLPGMEDKQVCTREDLVPGAKIIFHCATDKSDLKVRIVESVVPDSETRRHGNQGEVVVYEGESTNLQQRSRYLADAGIEPYSSNGFWNQINWTELVSKKA